MAILESDRGHEAWSAYLKSELFVVVLLEKEKKEVKGGGLGWLLSGCGGWKKACPTQRQKN